MCSCKIPGVVAPKLLAGTLLHCIIGGAPHFHVWHMCCFVQQNQHNHFQSCLQEPQCIYKTPASSTNSTTT
jgi:hypothetical protein